MRHWRIALAGMVLLYAWEAASAMVIGQSVAQHLATLFQPLQELFK